jgi:signal transduction histidine kinase
MSVTTVVLLLTTGRGGYTARVILELVVAGGFLAAGLYVLGRGRSTWFGLLAVAVAGGLMLESWRFSDVPGIYTLGLLFGSLWSTPLLHMVLAFPSGRLQHRLERLFVAGSYVVVIVVQPLPFLFWSDPFRPVCDPCPENLALVHDNQALANALMAAFLAFGSASMLFLAGYLVWRLRTASAHQRTVFMPVAVTTGATLLLLAVSAIAEASGAVAFAQAANIVYLGAFATVPVAMVTGLLRSRAFRAEAVSGLVERLDAPLGPDGLQDALAYALDDATLRLGFWVPEQAGYVDARGRPLDTARVPGRSATTIESHGRPVALIGYDAALDDEPGLVRSAGAAVRLALERERLAAALRANVAELRASRIRLVDAGDAERRRLERNLHDGAQPRLVALLLNLNLARRDHETNGAGPILDEVERELRGVLADLRALASGILPPALTDLGLDAAIAELAARMPFRVDWRLPRDRLPERVELCAYFVIAEALTNAAKHAQPTRVDVCVDVDAGSAIVEVADDGVGGAAPSGGSGLRGLADRVETLDGELTVRSRAGAGTTVRAEIPCVS